MDTPYATLVKAARSLQKRELLDDSPQASIDRVEKYFEVNRSELDQVNEALARKPSVPLKYHPNWLSTTADSHRQLGYLAFVFSMEVRLWAHRRDFARAAEVGIKGLEYCNALRRGGLMLDAIISGGCATPILQQLNRIRSKLKPAERRHLIAELGRIESERETFATIEERDKKWEATVNALLPDTSAVDRLIDDLEASQEIFVDEKERGEPTADLRARMKEHFLFAYEEKLSAPVEEQRTLMKQVYLDDRDGETHDDYRKRIAHCDRRSLCLIRMLMADLMVRSFKEEHGHYPDRLDQLTLDGAMICPVDPLTGQPFIYRRKSTRKFFWMVNEAFDLYSLGSKVVGGGGAFGSWIKVMSGEADLCLDWSNYQEDN